MDCMKISLFGGCLNGGAGQISINSIYHRIMAREIEARTGIHARVKLCRVDFLQLDGLREGMLQHVQDHQPDMIIFHLRPHLLWGIFSPLWLVYPGRGLGRLRLNPQHFKCSSWAENSEFKLLPMRRFAMVNWLFSQMLGIESRANRLIYQLVHDLHEICESRGVSLVTMGPVFGDWYLPAFRTYVAQTLMPQIRQQFGSCIDLLESESLAQPSHWIGDKFHLNALGHQEVARLVLEVVLPICEKKIAPRQ
jgi:hypothetical protein